MHITHDKGDIAEAAVILDLTKRGFTVFKPLTQNTYADVIIMKNDRIETVQIKFVTASNGKLPVPLRKQMSTTKEVRETYKYNQTNLDWIAVYSPDPELVLYLPRGVWSTNGVQMDIRLNTTKNKQTKNVRMYNDYLNV
jgi:hypothetical protein